MPWPLAGNRTVQQNLATMTAGGRLPHAILITGEAGLGKRTLAAYLARAAVCTGENPPCGECRGCHLAEVGTHPDLLTVEPEEKKKSISVAQVRQVRQEAQLKPHMANRRVFLFPQADALGAEAQNALLKVLEEPPAGALFLLLAPSEQQLLETVRSRCTRFVLAPPEREEALAVLAERVKKPREELAAALDATGGNVGRALALLQRKRTQQNELAARFLDQLLEGRTIDLLLTVQPLEKDRVAAAEFFSELQNAVAQALRDNCRAADPRFSRAGLLRLADFIREAADCLPRNVNLPLLLSYLCAGCKSRLISADAGRIINL